MSQRTTGRLAAATALAATLALTAPVSAAAAERSPSAGLWQWLEGLLPQRIAALWTGGERRVAKQGERIDPDGSSATQSNPAGGPACRMWSEQGVCIDPDG
jgi:hypothetical protein